MKLSGAEIVVETLIEQNVKTIFGYPGGTVLDIYDQLYKKSDRITHVLTAHEQGAAHAADGYARATGEIGVVLATSGPGATNLVTGIATAHLDSVPLLAITGNVANNLIGRDCFQEIDISGVTLPITKHNFIVHNVEDLADTIREAIRSPSPAVRVLFLLISRRTYSLLSVSSAIRLPLLRTRMSVLLMRLLQRQRE